MTDDKEFGGEVPRGPKYRASSAGGGGRTHQKTGFSLDGWVLVDGVMRRWYWLILAAAAVAAGAYFYTKHIWRNAYTASVQLIRFETPNSTVEYKPRQLTDQTFASLLKSPELLYSVVTNENVRPRMSVGNLASRLVISPARESDVVIVMVGGMDLHDTVALANLYAEQATKFTQELQKKDAKYVSDDLRRQLARLDTDITNYTAKLSELPLPGTQPSSQTAQIKKLLQDTTAELEKYELKFTEAHPLVQQKRLEQAALQKKLASIEAEARSAPAATGRGAVQEDAETIRSQLQALANSRVGLAARQREAQMYLDAPPGYCKIFAPATEKDVKVKRSEPKVLFMTIAAGLTGFFFALCLVLLIEIMDTRLKSPRDVSRVTDLPVLATLGDLSKMNPAQQRAWAFKTWTAIQGKLSSSPNHGLVCGVTSAGTKEGRSTWVNMLAQAASECGFRVLTVATLPPDSPELSESYAAALPGANGAGRAMLPGQKKNGESNHALAKSVLSSPMEVTEQLTGDDPQPMVHIPLPGWVWNLERRKQWQSALQEWRQIENIVILVELPPASEPEAVLLAQNLPNLIWLSDTGVVHAGPTREHLQTLRDARCNLVGSVVNHAPTVALKDRFSRWTSCLALCLLALSALNGRGATAEEVLRATLAQGANPAPPSAPAVKPVPAPADDSPRIETNLTFSAFRSDRRAPWQQRFTLGPGDVLNFALFGQPEFNRADVPVGPDGRVSYLQAQDIMAMGLTIDELRAKMDEELAKFYRGPHTIITPVAYNSKKYFVLGKVVNAGAFPLDHPVSVVEAVARAHGLQTGILDNQNAIDLVDLQKSFLMRGGKRITVDLEKLFQHGDLSQNVALEPNDYLYFAPGILKEVYVLGEIRSPGPLVQTDNTTVIGAIASRGGFTDRAYKSKVLVIRGSLNAPQTFVVDTLATVDARGLDFRLQPKDIVYVSWRPFIKAEELLDLAATAFIQSTVAAWAGQNIGPFITTPFLPSL